MSSTSLQPAPAPAEAAVTPLRRPRLLMLTHRLPYPPDRGDRIRSFHLLKLLARHFDVALASTSEEPTWLQHHQLLSGIAKRVAIFPISPAYSRFKALGALIRGQPLTPTCFYRDGLAHVIRQWHEQQPFDAVLTFCTGMIRYARLVTQSGDPAHRPRHVLDLVDVDSAKWSGYARGSRAPKSWIYALEARRLRRVERGEFDPFDALTVVSQRELEVYREQVGDHPRLRVVGNGVDLDYFHPLPDHGNPAVVFVGVLNYKPNADGVAWFARQVMPLLRRRLPEARFLIVGRHPTRRIEALGEIEGVEVIGSVPDVREYMEEASVVVAPLLLARGVQNKVLEAMACGRTVVASPAAAEGIDAADGEHLLVADAPEQWVDQITRALGSAELRQRIGAAARQRVETRYTWDQCLQPLVELLGGEAPSLS